MHCLGAEYAKNVFAAGDPAEGADSALPDLLAGFKGGGLLLSVGEGRQREGSGGKGGGSEQEGKEVAGGERGEKEKGHFPTLSLGGGFVVVGGSVCIPCE